MPPKQWSRTMALQQQLSRNTLPHTLLHSALTLPPCCCTPPSRCPHAIPTPAEHILYAAPNQPPHSSNAAPTQPSSCCMLPSCCPQITLSHYDDILVLPKMHVLYVKVKPSL